MKLLSTKSRGRWKGNVTPKIKVRFDLNISINAFRTCYTASLTVFASYSRTWLSCGCSKQIPSRIPSPSKPSKLSLLHAIRCYQGCSSSRSQTDRKNVNPPSVIDPDFPNHQFAARPIWLELCRSDHHSCFLFSVDAGLIALRSRLKCRPSRGQDQTGVLVFVTAWSMCMIYSGLLN